MAEYRAAIVGAGRKAGPIDDERMPGDRAWLKPWGHASAYLQTPGCRLAAVADIDAAKLASFCDRYGVPPEGRYTDYRTMIERERPHIVSVTTHAPLHAEIAIFAAEHGVRAVYCEKALACSLAEADRMLEVFRRNRVAFNYGAGRRYRPGYRAMRQLAVDGHLGRVQQFIFNGGGGSLMHGLSHAVDTALLLLGNPEPAFVQATIVRGAYDPRENRWDSDPGVAQASIHFADGSGAHFCAQGAPWYTFSLVGTTGLAMAYDNNSEYRLRRLVDAQTFRTEEVPFPAFRDESDTLIAIRELIRAVEQGRPEDTGGTLAEAHRGMELLCMMAESHLRNGARVTLPLENRGAFIPSR